MAKQGAKAVVPRLRFPEFREGLGWQIQPLGATCEVQNNRRRPITSSDRESGPYPYYGASGVVDSINDYIFDERLLLVGEDGAKWGSFEKTAFIAEGKYWVNNHAHVLKTTRVSDSLLENYLTMLDIAPFVTGAAPPKLTLAKLKGIPIPVPPTSAEQQKIADCLTSLDEVIAAQGRKVEALKAHKRGLMQQLFPREGETRPRLRFPEFRDAPEWDNKSLGELGAIITGKTPSTKDASLWGGGVLFITPTDISDDAKYQHETQRYVIRQPGVKVLPVGSIVYTCIASIGKMAITVLPSATNQQINSIVVARCNTEFLFYALAHLTPWIKTIPASSTLPIINKSAFSEIRVWIPSRVEEQQRIASCLSSLDAQITAESTQLAALKTHKQGLMQQLFPAIDEVSA